MTTWFRGSSRKLARNPDQVRVAYECFPGSSFQPGIRKQLIRQALTDPHDSVPAALRIERWTLGRTTGSGTLHTLKTRIGRFTAYAPDMVVMTLRTGIAGLLLVVAPLTGPAFDRFEVRMICVGITVIE